MTRPTERRRAFLSPVSRDARQGEPLERRGQAQAGDSRSSEEKVKKASDAHPPYPTTRQQRRPRKRFLGGVGGAVLEHILAFLAALLFVFFMSALLWSLG